MYTGTFVSASVCVTKKEKLKDKRFKKCINETDTAGTHITEACRELVLALYRRTREGDGHVVLLLDVELPGEALEVGQLVPHTVAVLLSQLPGLCSPPMSFRFRPGTDTQTQTER